MDPDHFSPNYDELEEINNEWEESEGPNITSLSENEASASDELDPSDAESEEMDEAKLDPSDAESEEMDEAKLDPLDGESKLSETDKDNLEAEANSEAADSEANSEAADSEANSEANSEAADSEAISEANSEAISEENDEVKPIIVNKAHKLKHLSKDIKKSKNLNSTVKNQKLAIVPNTKINSKLYKNKEIIKSKSSRGISKNNKALPEINPFLYQTTNKHPNIKTIKKISTQISMPISNITILTYNIWFDEKYIKARTYRIINLIKSYSTDIVCLQEVTPQTYQLIKSKLENHYEIFQIFIDEGLAYGSLILCKKETVEVVEPYYYDFPKTNMGRKLLGCEVKMRIQQIPNIHILTTHLESMWENSNIRNTQFNTIKEACKKLDNVILAGDLNICSFKEALEDNILNSKFDDCWIKLGCPTSIKYTFDSKLNSNIQGSYRSRLDRVLYYFNSIEHTLHSMQLIGLNSTSPDIDVPPSDHFGLIVEFRV